LPGCRAATIIHPPRPQTLILIVARLASRLSRYTARLATLGHPLRVAALAVFGGPAAAAFAVLHGMGNGVLTIAKGTLPLAVFGPGGYGARQGLLGAPARLLQAASPFLFGLVLERAGVQAALTLTTGCSLLALLALLLLRPVSPSALPARPA